MEVENELLDAKCNAGEESERVEGVLEPEDSTQVTEHFEEADANQLNSEDPERSPKTLKEGTDSEHENEYPKISEPMEVGRECQDANRNAWEEGTGAEGTLESEELTQVTEPLEEADANQIEPEDSKQSPKALKEGIETEDPEKLAMEVLDECRDANSNAGEDSEGVEGMMEQKESNQRTEHLEDADENQMNPVDTETEHENNDPDTLAMEVRNERQGAKCNPLEESKGVEDVIEQEALTHFPECRGETDAYQMNPDNAQHSPKTHEEETETEPENEEPKISEAMEVGSERQDVKHNAGKESQGVEGAFEPEDATNIP